MAGKNSTERPKGSSLKPLRSLVPFILAYRGVLVAAMLALLVASAAMLALPVALRYLIDNGFAANDVGTITATLAGSLPRPQFLVVSPRFVTTWFHGSVSGSWPISVRGFMTA